ncbi:hypothetical protein [Thiolapillus brandeum]|uniref:hypothetical protein n=1 Tax=Thiolapillus brandeum TaxID=1076588 RepID=UPI00155A605F|nr:hypothetical protein [Thiolapillus brandeum]
MMNTASPASLWLGEMPGMTGVFPSALLLHKEVLMSREDRMSVATSDVPTSL